MNALQNPVLEITPEIQAAIAKLEQDTTLTTSAAKSVLEFTLAFRDKINKDYDSIGEMVRKVNEGVNSLQSSISTLQTANSAMKTRLVELGEDVSKWA